MVANIMEGIESSSILEGFVSGTSAGIVLALFFWAIEQRRRRSERKEQISYLVRLISTHRDLMYKPSYPVGPPIETDVGIDIFRAMEIEQLAEDINHTLDGRCSRLSFDEINELRSLINEWKRITGEWMPVGGQFTDGFCAKLFHSIESIKWLGLPKDLDFLGSLAERGDGDESGQS